MAASTFSTIVLVVFFVPYNVSQDFALWTILLIPVGMVRPVRAVSFSPGGKLLAAAGDSKIIALYDALSGEQVANLTGHVTWILSLDWNNTGEYLLSGQATTVCEDHTYTNPMC